MVEVLGELGMSLLEQGRAMDTARDHMTQLRATQARIVRRVSGDAYLEAAPRMARTLLGPGANGGDFKVCGGVHASMT